MKQPENSIPSFAELAIQYKMVTQEQLNEAYLYVKDKNSQSTNTSSTLEEALVLKKILTQYQVNLIKVVRDFLLIKKKSEQFGLIAVKKGYATVHEVKFALQKQQQLFREKKIKKMVGDILVESDVLTKEQQQIIANEQQNILKERLAIGETKPESQFGDKTNQNVNFIKKIDNGTDTNNRQDDSKQIDGTQDDGTQDDGTQDDGTQINGKQDDEQFEVIVSTNGMEAWVRILPDAQNSIPDESVQTESALNSAIPIIAIPTIDDSAQIALEPNETNLLLSEKKQQITIDSIKSALEKKKIKLGVLSDSILQNFIDRKDDFFSVAIGEYLYSNLPEYSFNVKNAAPENSTSNSYSLSSKNYLSIQTPIIGDTTFKKNKVLASLDFNQTKISMKDVFDKFVITLNDGSQSLLRCGKWVTIAEDGASIVSEQSGYPALSIDGKLYIFPVVNVLGDADLRFGPIQPYASVSVSGVLTGIYPLTAGQVKAREVRGASVSSIGDIDVEIGINRSRIKCQGSLRATYIHNSRVEAFGDVFVEHEIIDSTIIISGKCHIPKGRVIASRIYAKMGISAAAIGSNVTEPCYINVGCEEHIIVKSIEISQQINTIRKELDDLTEEKKSLEQKIKEAFDKMVELKILHDNAKAQSLQYNEEKESLNDVENKEKTKHLINEMKKKMEQSIDSLKKYNQQKKSLEIRVEKIENEINKIKPKVENSVAELELDRNRYLKWAEATKPTAEIRVSGRLSEGTLIKGMCASMTVKDDLRGVELIEKKANEDSSSDSVQWIIYSFPT